MKISHAATAAAVTLAGLAAASMTASVAGPAVLSPAHAREGSIEHGRYIVVISGCNDCHTPGYAQSGGKSPTGTWLTGASLGFQGPWGTSYPANLRLTVQSMTEAQWLVFARAERRPPMPWFNLVTMSDQDLRDVYRFIRALGPAGTPAPAAVAPGGKVVTPYISWEPRNLPAPSVTQSAPPPSGPQG